MKVAYNVFKFTNLNCSLEINLSSSPGSVLYLPRCLAFNNLQMGGQMGGHKIH